MSGSKPPKKRPPRRPTVAEERAAAQANASVDKAARQAALDARFGDSVPGRPIVVANVGVTVVFSILSVAAVGAYDTLATPAVVVDLTVFIVGLVVFAAALWLGAQRSREAEMDIAGWFFFSRVGPPQVRWPMLGALAIQVVVGIATALLSHDAAVTAGDRASKLAFGTLVPVFGLALCGLWGARYGAFPPRQNHDQPVARRR